MEVLDTECNKMLLENVYFYSEVSKLRPVLRLLRARGGLLSAVAITEARSQRVETDAEAEVTVRREKSNTAPIFLFPSSPYIII